MSDAPDSPLPAGASPASAELEDLLHQRLQQAPIGLFETDAAGGCVFINRQISVLSGLDADRALGWDGSTPCIRTIVWRCSPNGTAPRRRAASSSTSSASRARA